MIPAIRSRLGELADATASSRDMQDRRDAMMDFDRKGQAWAQATMKAWQKALVPPTATARFRMDEAKLELIGDEVVERKILSSRLALAIQEKATWELNDLRLRMQHLEGGDELAGDRRAAARGAVATDGRAVERGGAEQRGLGVDPGRDPASPRGAGDGSLQVRQRIPREPRRHARHRPEHPRAAWRIGAGLARLGSPRRAALGPARGRQATGGTTQVRAGRELAVAAAVVTTPARPAAGGPAAALRIPAPATRARTGAGAAASPTKPA